MDIGAKLLRAICAKGEVYAYIQAKLEDKHFYSHDEKQMFAFVNGHVEQFHALPHEKTLLEKFPETPEALEPVNYYMEKVVERFSHKTMNTVLGEVSLLLEGKEIDTSITKLQAMLAEVIRNNLRTKMAEFGEDAPGIITQEYLNATSNPSGILFGWPYLDTMTMGLFPGDVCSYVGRPQQGKTYKMLYTAHHAWKTQKKSVLFVSMEMAIPPLVQRLTAITAKVSATELKKGLLPTLPKNMWQHVQNTLLQQQGQDNKLWILDGNLTSTPEQIFTLANQLQPDIVFIDGAYLLKHPNPRLDRYTRVAENIEYIKFATSAVGIPSTLSYQFNRESMKKKPDQKVGLEDIAFSDAIGQISSIVLGLFQQETVESMMRKRVEVLKGREGATGEYDIFWNFNTMDFSQVPDEDSILDGPTKKHELIYL